MTMRRKPRTIRAALAPLAVGAALLAPGAPRADEAAEETCPEEPTIRVRLTGASGEDTPRLSGLHVLLAPGVIHVPLDGEDDPGYQWGLGAAWLFRPVDGPFAIDAGIGLEHSIGNPPDQAGYDFESHQVRVEAQARPGAVLVGEALWVFGEVGFGYVAWPTSSTVGSMTTENATHGLVLTLGAGVSYTVWDGLAVGGGFGFDLQWFFAGGPASASHNFDFAVLAGWHF
ncbi:MAG: hypothetical protein HY907_06410 [Deltaproteobacteria bacterium]|nr:hypothetical protein [Deltaproteobacteria bacterium]